jgi:hypothetical protein
MAENTETSLNASGINGANSSQSKSQRRPKKQYQPPVQTNESRTILTIQAKVSNTPKSCSDTNFPLFRPFVTSQESDVLYIKTSKRCIVNLSNGEKFSPNTSGYLVIL